MDKRELKALCNGNRTDRGWTENEAGTWTPSVHDRRRVVTSTLQMVAEENGGMVHGPVIMSIIKANAVDAEDLKVLTEAVAKRISA